MAVTPTKVKDLASEFSGLSDAYVQQYIDIAECLVKESVWGDCAEKATLLMSAHLTALSTRGGASGPISSEKVADLQRSYGSISNAGTDLPELNLTSYGVMLKQLNKATFIMPFCV